MRNFATSANVQIMVVTVGTINKKDVNNLYKESEKTGGEKPIDLIRATRPIGSLFTDDLRDKESGKIECGQAHFESLIVCENPAQYMVARNINDLLGVAAR